MSCFQQTKIVTDEVVAR